MYSKQSFGEKVKTVAEDKLWSKVNVVFGSNLLSSLL